MKTTLFFLIGLLSLGLGQQWLYAGGDPVVLTAKGIGKAPPGAGGATARALARRAAQKAALDNLLKKLRQDFQISWTHQEVRGFRYLSERSLARDVVEIRVGLPLSVVLSNYRRLARRYQNFNTELAQARQACAQAQAELAATRARYNADSSHLKSEWERQRRELELRREELLQQFAREKQQTMQRLQQQWREQFELEKARQQAILKAKLREAGRQARQVQRLKAQQKVYLQIIRELAQTISGLELLHAKTTRLEKLLLQLTQLTAAAEAEGQ